MYNCQKHGLQRNTYYNCDECIKETQKMYETVSEHKITLEQMDKDMNYKKGMTKKEAFEIGRKAGYPDPSYIIGLLSDLGLLKLEEDKKDIIQEARECTIQYPGHPSTPIIKTLIEELEKRPKIGDNVIIDYQNRYVRGSLCGD